MSNYFHIKKTREDIGNMWAGPLVEGKRSYHFTWIMPPEDFIAFISEHSYIGPYHEIENDKLIIDDASREYNIIEFIWKITGKT